MKYQVLFRLKGNKRWLIKSGGLYTSKKNAMSFPKSNKYEYKLRKVN